MTPSPESLLVWGAGGHGKVVADLIRACGLSVAGFVDGDEEKLGKCVGDGRDHVVMLEEELFRNLEEERRIPHAADAVAVALGENGLRQRALGLLAEYPVRPLVHPSSTVSPTAILGPGTVVFPGAVVNADAQIGRGVIVNSAAVVEHDCLVADAAHVSPGAVLAGGVRVGERSWIGAGATVIESIEIGHDVVVGAGAAVIRDVPPQSVVVGVPARPLHRG